VRLALLAQTNQDVLSFWGQYGRNGADGEEACFPLSRIAALEQRRMSELGFKVGHRVNIRCTTALPGSPSAILLCRGMCQTPTSAGLFGAGRSTDGGTSQPSALAVLRVDHQLILRRRLHRQVGRLLALEEAIDVAGRASVRIDAIGTVKRSGRLR
jgi:hypothetical protein